MSNTMNNVMLDLETVSTSSNAAIISIGAIFFDPLTGELGAEFHQPIDLESAMQHGVADASTVAWWMKQSDEARKIFNHKDSCGLEVALYDFTDWVHQHGPEVQVWGNGATFDNVILSNAYDSISYTRPWLYANDRDVRTVVELGRTLCNINPKKHLPFEGTEHNALDDAKHQARYVSEIFKALAVK